MKVLFIAPLPPPITGQSVASQALLTALNKSHEIDVVDFQKGTFKQGVTSLRRIIDVIRVLLAIKNKKRNADAIYLTISQSISGNIKDLLIYLFCFDKISSLLVHLHGGGIRKIIFDKYGFLSSLNNFFLKRVGGIIVLGKSLIPIFENMVPNDRIHVVPNFASDALFLSEEKIPEKFREINPLRLLFLSNLIPGKGHGELLEAFKALDEKRRKKFLLSFAGGFEDKEQEQLFLKEIDGVDGVTYHGVVSGNEKSKLFAEAHVFCLPTYYPYYEGQPISILEAYASGCVVITTDHGGICDIFKDGQNGYFVQKRSVESIVEVIEKLANAPAKELLKIALYNRTIAGESYRAERYVTQIKNILESSCRAGQQ